MSRVLGGEEFAEAYNTFHLHYGLTLAEWAKIEQRLFYWFEKLSQTNHVMARAIFYSAKSLKARLDMFQAALAVADPPPPVRAFLEEMLTKIAGYSTFRNIIVHGEPVLDPRDSSPTFGQFLLVQANKLPYAAPSSSVTVDQLKIASANFAALGTIITRASILILYRLINLAN
jgi:hypothetical protein